jgi:hypothetical protein
VSPDEAQTPEEAYRLGRLWVRTMRTSRTADELDLCVYEGIRDAIRDTDTIAKVNLMPSLRAIFAYFWLGFTVGALVLYFIHG